MKGLGRDAKLLIASTGIASLAGGFAGVVQPIYLALLGIPPVLIGLNASIAIVAGAVRMVLFGVAADRVGRRVVLLSIFAASVTYNLIYFAAADYSLFLLASIIGGASGEGYGGYIEGALLAEKAGDDRRTLAFSAQYFVASSFSAFGSLATGLPDTISQSFGVKTLDAIRLIYALQAALVFIASTLIIPIKESRMEKRRRAESYLSGEARSHIIKLATIGLFNGLGVGMVVSLFPLWFYLRFGIGIKTVGYIFAASKVFETLTYLLGPPIAARLGLIRTISIVRLGGAAAAALMAFMPNYTLAAVMFTLRNAIQHISLPLRQSYVMSIFNRRERASAASLSNLADTIGNTIASTFSGYIMESINTTIPVLASAAFFGISSQLYYIFFRDIKPPEERQTPAS
jgi:MFS family permease